MLDVCFFLTVGVNLFLCKPGFGESPVATHGITYPISLWGFQKPGGQYSKWNLGGLAWSAGQLATGVPLQFAWLGGGQARGPPTFAHWPPWASP